MKRTVLLLVALFTMAMAADNQDLAAGSAIENFSLPDINGNVQTLNRLKGQKGALVIFLSTQCPMVKAYKDRINQIATDAHAKGINFIGINSNSTETVNWIKSNASGFGYRFPILIDKGNVLADTLDVHAAPEVILVNGDNLLLYRGAIDNDRAGTKISASYLTAAIDASVTGKEITKSSIAPSGCSINRVGDSGQGPKN